MMTSFPAAAAAASSTIAAQSAGAEAQALPPSLVFSETASSAPLVLMELTPALQQALAATGRLELKAEADEDAVLCTETQTYLLKTTDVSDSMYLVPPLQGSTDVMAFSDGEPRVISAIAHAYFEATECAPRLDKLRRLLRERPYAGPEAEATHGPSMRGLYTTEDLLDKVQASTAEIMQSLRRLHAFERQGHWRIMSDSYTREVFEALRAQIESMEIPWNAVPLPSIVDAMALHEVEPDIVAVVLRRFSADDEPSSAVYRMEPKKICRFYAEELLSVASASWKFEDFYQAWQAAVPVVMDVSLDMLEDLALITVQSVGGFEEYGATQRVISYLPVERLPREPKDRVEELFRVRPIWTHAEILPYIRDIVTPGTTAERLLFKFARAFEKDGVKLYKSR